MKAPVVLFVYNRPQHTRRTLAALASAEDATETPLYIYSDGAKSNTKESVEETRYIIRNIKGFKSVTIIERETNIGLANNIINGVSEVIKEHGRAIVLEDDLIVSKCFLKYMNQALDYYEDKNIFSISGYTPAVKLPPNYKHTTYFTLRNCSWGWATWRAKWEKTDWEVKDFDLFIRNRDMRSLFDKSGSDLSAMLLRYKIGEIHSWSIRFCYAGFKLNEPTVYPTQSMICNGGVDGSGTNMKQSTKYETNVTDFIDCSLFADKVEVNPLILLSFKRFYDCSPIRKIINALKRMRYIINH